MTKPVLLFAHAFPLNSSLWDSQVEYFEKQFKVLAPDLRGHRNGSRGPGPWMIAHYVEDLRQLLIEQKTEKVHFCGLSMGSYIALQFAQKYPEMIASLILSDTRADADSNEAKDKRFALIQRVHREGLPLFAVEFAKTALGETTQKEKPDLIKKVALMINGNTAAGVAAAAGALASRHDSTEALAKFKFPCLVMVGEEDRVTPPELAEKMAEAIPNAKFKKIPQAGHFANLEQPKIFNAHLEEFLNSVK